MAYAVDEYVIRTVAGDRVEPGGIGEMELHRRP
jgi:hypothetical protein